MNQETIQRVADLLKNGKDIAPRSEVESRYPKRQLPEGAHVTRFAPSPTGFMHVGAIFTAQICQRIAVQTNGVYMLRIEDTDKKREVEGSKELIAQQLNAFELAPDEGLQLDGSTAGEYGPYVQSERQDMYLAYAIDLLEKGRAYPCFATSEELQESVKDQQQKKLRPGYYGDWALWRDRSDDDVNAALEAGRPFVLRFKSNGSHQKRTQFKDAIKGLMDVPENDLDVPLIKSDEHRLPTYHLAHVVDDHLMGATIIFRGEEWLPSTPLHIELSLALGIRPFKYAHTPVISILDKETGSKRKLSKRKDPEADVAFWREAAYPLKSIKAYLLGLANSNFDDWYRENPAADLNDFLFTLEKLKTSRSPLLDMKKLEDYTKNEIALMPQEHFNKEVMAWTNVHDHDLYDAMLADSDYTNSVLAIERDGEKPRKDVAKWSDAPIQFGYFYDSRFTETFQNGPEASEFLITYSDEQIARACKAFLGNYNHSADKDAWFANLKSAAESENYALDRKEHKANPDKYVDFFPVFASIIRVKVTGRTRTPDLHAIMQILGQDTVTRRLSS
ncbi:MAG: glutamyl-tRNA synthetase [Candidatus Saccharimonadales bacterium]|jgi:glutamyl-tRNA synthetase